MTSTAAVIILVYATSQTARSSFARPQQLIDAVKDAAAANDHKACQFIEKAVERALKSKKT